VTKVSAQVTQSQTPTYLFRADDRYTLGDPIGFELDSNTAQRADIQTPWEHILDKETGQTSRYLSVSTAIRLQSGGGAQKFTKKGKIFKVSWESVQALEIQAKLRSYTPAQVAEIIEQHPKKKIRKQANNVKEVMEKNGEILIEGQIPGNLLVLVK
jgi:hypothetical protein